MAERSDEPDVTAVPGKSGAAAPGTKAPGTVVPGGEKPVVEPPGAENPDAGGGEEPPVLVRPDGIGVQPIDVPTLDPAFVADLGRSVVPTECDFTAWQEDRPPPRFMQGRPPRAFTEVEGRTIPARSAIVDGRPPARLLGDYWHETRFDVGPVNRFWRSDRSSQGTLTSAPTVVSAPFVSLLIGGGVWREAPSPGRPDDLRVELWVRDPTFRVEDILVVDPHPELGGNRRPFRVPPPPGTPLDHPSGLPAEMFEDGPYVRRQWERAPGTDVMRRVNWSVDASARPVVRVRAVDNSDSGHVTVADVRCSARPLPQPRAEVWGVADLHSHPMSHLGFGKRMIAGRYPASSVNPDDVGRCDGGIHTSRGVSVWWPPGGEVDLKGFVLDQLTAEDAHHGGGHDGASSFLAWPQFADGLHAQMHPEWIRRAFDGGLRLMVALAIHNEKVAFEFPEGPGAPLQDDYEATVEQLRFWKDVCRTNESWMAIAKTPVDARQIIGEGRLAVVLGVEVDRALGIYATEEQLQEVAIRHFPGASPVEAMRLRIREDLRGLWAEGARQINPIHLTDNAFGGAAIYQEMFNIANQFVTNGRYMRVRAAEPRDGIDYRFGEEGGGITPVWLQRRPPAAEAAGLLLVAGAIFPPVLGLGLVGAVAGAASPPMPGRGPYSPPDYRVDSNGVPIPLGTGHRNVMPLTLAGQLAIEEMMRQGWMIDIDHMSQSSMEQTLQQVERGTSGVPRPYPVISAHGSYRELSPRRNWANRDDPVAPGQRRAWHTWPHESEKARSTLQAIARLGGIVAPITSHLLSLDHAAPAERPAVENDCAASSKTWAQEFLYATSIMGDRGVGLGTDMGLIHQIAPRFGPRAAFGLKGEYHVGFGEVVVSAYLDRARQERREQAEKQRNGVCYATPLRREGATPYPPDPLFSALQNTAWAALDAHARGVRPTEDERGAVRVAHAVPLGGLFVDDRLELLIGFHATTEEDASTHGGLSRAAYRALHGMAPQNEEQVQVRVVVELWAARTGTNRPLRRCTDGPRDWDFNTDGLAHYGLLPDFFQDLANVGLPTEAMATLFRSAEDYISVWERCFRTRWVHYPEDTPVEFSDPEGVPAGP